MDFQRVFIFMGLAVTGYFLILSWQQDYGAQVTQPLDDASVTVTESYEGAASPQSIPSDASLPDATSIPSVAVAEAPLRPSITRNPIQVSTDVFRVTIDPEGGDLISVALPKFPATLDRVDQPLRLVSDFNHYRLQSGLIGPDGIDRSSRRPFFTSPQMSYTQSGTEDLVVSLKWEDAEVRDLDITKQFRFKPGSYLVEVEYTITNQSSTPKTMAFFGQIKRDGEPPQDQDSNVMGLQPFIGGATRRVDERYHKLTLDDLEEAPYQYDFEGGYIAFLQHYFLTAWIPSGEQKVRYFGKPVNSVNGPSVFALGYTAAPVTVQPGESTLLGGQLYIGPKDQVTLAGIADGLDLTVDYGFLWFIAQPLFSALTIIFDWVGNWGLAIILLTVLVKALLYPLSAASFKSMAKMRKLQPEMVRLRDRYGDDRQKLGQAMMDLYKKEGANPLGGCLPILLQMPVFLALYWTLMESVELRQAPFIAWINDLSAMDPYFVLPILMGISMYLTQMMQPEPPDPVQAKVFKFMPIMFTFFFLWFPSGLVLYWLVNNILSVLQQLYVTRQLELGRD